MAYVDGFIVPLLKTKIDAYREVARKAGAIWRDHGALEYERPANGQHDGPSVDGL